MRTLRRGRRRITADRPCFRGWRRGGDHADLAPVPARARVNDTWPLLFGAAAVSGALLLGSIVGGLLAYVGTDPDGARRVARRMLLSCFAACILTFFYVMARVLDYL